MKFSIRGGTSLVIGGFDLVDMKEVAMVLEGLLQRATVAITTPTLKDWEIIFQFVLIGGIADIRVYHRRNSDPKRREKWVTIHLPIPISPSVWGVVPQNAILFGSGQADTKWCRTIPCDVHASTNLQEHCTRAARAGIIYALTTGLTVAGQQVRLELRALTE